MDTYILGTKSSILKINSHKLQKNKTPKCIPHKTNVKVQICYSDNRRNMHIQSTHQAISMLRVLNSHREKNGLCMCL